MEVVASSTGHTLAPMQHPTDAVTLLGCCFRGFGTWGVCETIVISAGKFLDTTIHLTTGMHELSMQMYKTGDPNQMPRAMSAAHYIPPSMATPLIDVVDHPQKKNAVQVA